MSGSEITTAIAAAVQAVHNYGPTGEWLAEHDQALTARLVEQEWDVVALPEHLGGSGGRLSDAVEVAAAIASCAHLLPLADAGIVSVHAAALVGLGLSAELRPAITADEAGTLRDGRVSLSTVAVPFGRWARSLLVPVATDDGSAGLAILAASDVDLTLGANLAGEPRDLISAYDVPARALATGALSATELLEQIRLAGALARSAQVAAAASAMVELCARYLGERHQFGRPLSAFQAVQQLVAGLAGEALAGRSAVNRAVAALDGGPGMANIWPTEPVAVARSRTGRTAAEATAIAHQLHGAIGTTREYPLHRLSRPVWAWREEYGNETVWAARLTADVLTANVGASLWYVLAPAEA